MNRGLGPGARGPGVGGAAGAKREKNKLKPDLNGAVTKNQLTSSVGLPIREKI